MLIPLPPVVVVQVVVAQLEEPGALPEAPQLPGPLLDLPPPRAAAPPLQFDRSLDELQRQGAVTLRERQQLEQGGTPLRPGMAGKQVGLLEALRVRAESLRQGAAIHAYRLLLTYGLASS